MTVYKLVHPFLFTNFTSKIIPIQCCNITTRIGTNKFQKRCVSNNYMDYSVPNDPSFRIKKDAFSHSKQNLTIHWQQDDKPNNFHALWLRHQCHCKECIQPSSGQSLLSPGNIPIHLHIEDAVMRDNLAHLKWSYGENGTHEGHIPLQWLHLNRVSYFEGQTEDSFKLYEFDFSEVIDSEKGLYEYLFRLNQNGVVKVRNTPDNDGARKLGEAISYIHPTVYGVTFDVVVKPNPDNVAYLGSPLLQHNDLNYYQHQPGLQHLNCVKLDKCVTGGILTLKDITLIAEDFRQKHSDEFNALARIKMQFNYIMFRSNTYLLNECTHFKLDANGDIESIRWGPNFQGPVMSQDPDDLETYFYSFKKFNDFVESYPTQTELQYNEGDIISFHNIRMVHARTAIELNGGRRVLQGCYSPLDEFRSRLRCLSVKLGKPIPKKIW